MRIQGQRKLLYMGILNGIAVLEPTESNFHIHYFE